MIRPILLSITVLAALGGGSRTGQAQVIDTARAARLRGVVVSAASGTPIADAQLVLLGMDQVATSGSEGHFDFGPLEPGSYIVQGRMLGYTPYTVRVELAPASALDLTFRLVKGAVQMQDLEARAVERSTPFMERVQAANGMGHFVTAGDLARRGVRTTCDAFRTVPGLRISTGSVSSVCAVRVIRAQNLSIANGDCPPAVYLNGVRGDMDLVETGIIPVTDIEGIEVYASNGTTPSEYSSPGSGCGVIAIWTRTGAKGGT